ncbi:unnamed protein product [Cochlearia groenlandica]
MGNTRRLPPWMLSVESAAESATNTRKEVKLKTESESPKVKVEKRPRRIVKSKEREDSDESNKKVKNKRRREVEEVDDDLTVDDLLSFAHEYVKGEEERRKERESLSISEESTVVVVDESNIMRLSNSQGEETNGSRRDSTANDDIMLGLLLGPFFNKPSSTIK